MGLLTCFALTLTPIPRPRKTHILINHKSTLVGWNETSHWNLKNQRSVISGFQLVFDLLCSLKNVLSKNIQFIFFSLQEFHKLEYIFWIPFNWKTIKNSIKFKTAQCWKTFILRKGQMKIDNCGSGIKSLTQRCFSLLCNYDLSSHSSKIQLFPMALRMYIIV